MTRYSLRIVTGPPYDENGPELVRALRTIVERRGIDVDVAYRRDSGLVLTATFATDSAGGALAAAGGICELVAEALERLTPRARRAWHELLSYAVVKVNPVKRLTQPQENTDAPSR